MTWYFAQIVIKKKKKKNFHGDETELKNTNSIHCVFT